jgi:peptidoglycan/xylan/chitin deacetylase (PgdA/CDA1 family)
MKERASITTRGDRELSPGPSLLYPAKAALTRARSLAWLTRTGGRRKAGLRILFFHRVSNDRDELAVTPAAFRLQMQALEAMGLRAVDVVTATTEDESEDVVGLSFDDGYLDVAEHAEPVLRELGFSATVFIATGVTAGHARFTWYDEQPPLIGWDEMRRLDGEGVLRFEAHTVTHPNLLALDAESARREIVDGKRELGEQLGREVTAFCYPAGLFSDRDRQLVADAGFRVAVSCEPGVNDAATDPLALRRIQIDARDSLLDFRAKAGGGHDSPPPLRRAYRRLRYGASSRS